LSRTRNGPRISNLTSLPHGEPNRPGRPPTRVDRSRRLCERPDSIPVGRGSTHAGSHDRTPKGHFPRTGFGADRIVGTTGADTIRGTDGIDVIAGRSGGDDWICLGVGNDWGAGQLGDDRIQGNGGDDELFGHRGNDRLTDATGTNTADGGGRTDYCLVTGSIVGCEAPWRSAHE
jgi:hypothetical protein